MQTTMKYCGGGDTKIGTFIFICYFLEFIPSKMLKLLLLRTFKL